MYPTGSCTLYVLTWNDGVPLLNVALDLTRDELHAGQSATAKRKNIVA